MAVEFPLHVNSTKRSGLSGRKIILAVRETSRTELLCFLSRSAPFRGPADIPPLDARSPHGVHTGYNKLMVPVERFELPTLRLQGDCSTVKS